MSIISLSSTSQDDIVAQQPFNFKNHFPQPILLEKKSQVCLVNFYHYRDSEYFRVDETNNIIGHCFGTSAKVTGYHYARLTTGRYTDGFALATEIARAMNASVVQQNYAFSCVYVKPNHLANPVILETFTISYDHVDAPDSKGGTWARLADEPDNQLVIVNDDTDNGTSTIKPLVNQTNTKTAVMRRGLLFHAGFYQILGISKAGGDELSDVKLHGLKCGIVRNLFSKVVPNSTANFDPNFADILVQVNTDDVTLVHEITISSLVQQQGTTSILASNGKNQKFRRRLTGTFINNNFNNTDLMGIKFFSSAISSAVSIQLLKSTDGGQTYTPLASDGSVNADGGLNVYTQTIPAFGSNLAGMIYSSLSSTIPIPSGGFVVGISSANTLAAIKAPMIPFLSIDNDQKKISGVDLDNIQVTSQYASAPQNFTLEFDGNDAGMNAGYDYSIGVVAVEQSAGAVTSSQLAGTAIKVKAGTDGTMFDLFPNKGVAPTAGSEIGTLKLETNGNGTIAQCIVKVASFATNPLNLLCAILPPITKETATFQVSGVFNHTLKELRFDAQGNPIDEKKTNHNEEDLSVEVQEDGLGAGAILPLKSTYLLGRLQQNDMQGNTGPPAFFTPDLVSGSVSSLLGFKVNFIKLLPADKSFTSDGSTTKANNDNNIHISIPELPNVKSFEGEISNHGKTIKIIPKNEFTKDETTGSMTFTANYEDWINVNNNDDLYINELSCQIRDPDGTLAKDLQPITRATLKFRQDPQVKEESNRNAMFEMMQSSMSAQIDTNAKVNVKYTGS